MDKADAFVQVISTLTHYYHVYQIFGLGIEILPCLYKRKFNKKQNWAMTGPRSAVGNVSGYRCVSDCRSRGREFDPGPVPYFRGD